MSNVEFTKAMKKTHKILIPMMLPIHFQFVRNILQNDGYQVELLETSGRNIIDEGLKNVHNDTCYPALLVIGQMIDALKSGQYDTHHIALAITQTGGGCRASNYIHLLRKALKQAGFEYVPVISVNFSNLEKNNGFKLSYRTLLRLLYAFLYGDMLMWIRNQVKPYELDEGISDALVTTWIETISKQFETLSYLRIMRNFQEILHDFDDIARNNDKKIQVGIVGEIYMKYAPLGNGDLENFLMQEGCEPVISGVLDFGLYCMENVKTDHSLYNRNRKVYRFVDWVSRYVQHLQNKAITAIEEQNIFRSPESFKELLSCSEGMIHKGTKMGEGWLLTSEMVALIKSGVSNIVCCQPFGCLPNHIVAKGMTRKIKNTYPNANIVAVDFDPGATKVNQENRLKLMLSNARLCKRFEKEEPEATQQQVYVYETN